MGSFQIVEEMALADCAVDLSARDLTDVFETSARALAEITVDPRTVPESVARFIALEAPTMDQLFFDWLSELIYLRDRDTEVYGRCDVQLSGVGPYHLAARLHGGRVTPGRTDRRADVKGVALNEFVLEPSEGGWHAHFMFNL